MTNASRQKIYRALSEITEKYHFSPLEEGPNGKVMPKNLVLMTLSYLLARNHLLVGEPGWGKTTGAKVVASRLSGLPYDVYDSLEIRGNPHKFEEKIVARFNFGSLSKGVEQVIWQGCFGLPALIIDEGNRLPYDSQDAILQGIDTGRWVYNNASLYEGKKPTFITMNEKPGSEQNGFIGALKDRFDIVTEHGYWSAQVTFDLEEAKRARQEELENPEYTTGVLEALAKNFDAFKKSIGKRPIAGHLRPEELAEIRADIMQIDAVADDNDPVLFLQTFMAEVDFSRKYGRKRAVEPISDDTHDQNYAGIHVLSTFSPRSVMAANAYARGLAWFLGEPLQLDHVRYVLPHIFATKAVFTNDYINKWGNAAREEGECQSLDLSRRLVGEVYDRYQQSIQPMKNWIAILRAWYSGERDEIKPQNDQEKALVKDLTAIEKGKLRADDAESLKEDKYDHPLMIDIVREVKQPERAFYEKE